MDGTHRCIRRFSNGVTDFVFSNGPKANGGRLTTTVYGRLLLHNGSMLVVAITSVVSTVGSAFEGDNADRRRLLGSLDGISLLIVSRVNIRARSGCRGIVVGRVISHHSSSGHPAKVLAGDGVRRVAGLLNRHIVSHVHLNGDL